MVQTQAEQTELACPVPVPGKESRDELRTWKGDPNMGEMSGERPLISVIVPVYNAENYLRRCLDSIIGQTYANLEIILVDDGSTDRSGAICEEYRGNDSRICLIHQENKGLGEARNTGIDIATGSLLAFVDSDDWLEPKTYEIMADFMTQFQCDIVTCGRFDQTDTSVDYSYCQNDGVLIQSKDELIRRFLLSDGLDMAAWDKLYRAELFENIRYPKGHLMCEDFVPAYRILNKAESAYLCGLPLYHYYKHPNSITTSDISERLMGPAVYGPQVAQMVREEHPEMKNEADAFEIRTLMYGIQHINTSGGSKKAKKAIRAKLKQTDFKENPYFTKGYKTHICFTIYGLDIPYLALYRFLFKHSTGRKLLHLFR